MPRPPEYLNSFVINYDPDKGLYECSFKPLPPIHLSKGKNGQAPKSFVLFTTGGFKFCEDYGSPQHPLHQISLNMIILKEDVDAKTPQDREAKTGEETR